VKELKIPLLGVLLVTAMACSIFSPGTQTEEESTYENEDFSVTIPAGWGMMLFGGEYYDLGMEMIVTIHDNPIAIWSKIYFTVASSPLEAGDDLESRFTQTYELVSPMEEVSRQAFEREPYSGFEILYAFPYGEGWWKFHDIWLENDEVIYMLSFRTRANDSEDYSAIFEQIMNSFRFKE
jgi:hypothetical protein